MTGIAERPTGVLHPRASEFVIDAQPVERRIGLIFAVSGLGLVLLMGVLGILMRLTQAKVIDLAPAWFYRLLTLHGGGMIVGVLLVTMAAMWYVLHPGVPLRAGRMMVSYYLIVAGALADLVATLIGGFGAGWTFLPPLPFYPAGQWPVWSETVFFSSQLLVGIGFFVFCADVLQQVTSRYGGLLGALGWRYLWGQEDTAPPPQAIAAMVVAIDGLLTGAVGSAIMTGLLGRTYDHTVGIDALVAKNLVYFFGHSVANLTIYLAAGAVYVVLPRYAGRPYQTSKPFVAGWTGSLVFIVTGYSHHLYMDFVQPQWAQIISETTSYGALLPVAVITIYSMTMLVWGSRFRWTLASTLFYLGLGGWTIGGIGAVIDSLIPFNFRFHNTDWVVAHFHTYLILGVLLWGFAFLAHLLERDAERTSPRASQIAAISLILVGGYGLVGTWFLAGVLGVPRRYAIQPAGTVGYSLVGGIFALILAVGFLLLSLQLAELGRAAWRRHKSLLIDATVSAGDGRALAAGTTAEAGVAAGAGVTAEPGPFVPALTSDLDLPAVSAGPPVFAAAHEPDVPLATPAQLGIGVAAAVVGLVAFFPQVVSASEASVRDHHLDHAGHFFFGVMVGLVLGSLPRISRWLGERQSLGLGAVIVAPIVMMLVMVPAIYEPLEKHPPLHAAYHVGMAVLGLITGLGATRLGFVTGRVVAFLSVGSAVMFAAAMTYIT